MPHQSAQTTAPTPAARQLGRRSCRPRSRGGRRAARCRTRRTGRAAAASRRRGSSGSGSASRPPARWRSARSARSGALPALGLVGARLLELLAQHRDLGHARGRRGLACPRRRPAWGSRRRPASCWRSAGEAHLARRARGARGAASTPWPPTRFAEPGSTWIAVTPPASARSIAGSCGQNDSSARTSAVNGPEISLPSACAETTRHRVHAEVRVRIDQARRDPAAAPRRSRCASAGADQLGADGLDARRRAPARRRARSVGPGRRHHGARRAAAGPRCSPRQPERRAAERPAAQVTCTRQRAR